MACGQMCHYTDSLNVTFSSALLSADMNGFYDEATGTILSTGGSSTGGTLTPPGMAFIARARNAGRTAKPR